MPSYPNNIFSYMPSFQDFIENNMGDPWKIDKGTPIVPVIYKRPKIEEEVPPAVILEPKPPLTKEIPKVVFEEVTIEDQQDMIAEIFRLKSIIQAIMEAYCGGGGQELKGITEKSFKELLEFIREARKYPIKKPMLDPNTLIDGKEFIEWLKQNPLPSPNKTWISANGTELDNSPIGTPVWPPLQ